MAASIRHRPAASAVAAVAGVAAEDDIGAAGGEADEGEPVPSGTGEQSIKISGGVCASLFPSA